MQGFEQVEFYSAVSQVIPLLFVLLAFEFRVVDFAEWNPGDPRWWLYFAAGSLVGLIAAAALGEAAALRVLAERRVLDGADFLIVAAMLSAVVTMLVVPILEARARLPEKERRSKSARAVRNGLIGLLGIGTILTPAASVLVALLVVIT